MAEEKLLKRGLYCGELREQHSGERLTVYGWVNSMRLLGGLTFIDLRDREGLLQVVVNETFAAPGLLKEIGKETVLAVSGRVVKRTKPNPDLPSGQVELIAEGIDILAASLVPPFVPEGRGGVSEELRFKHRYIDLRNLGMQRNFKLRSQVNLLVRNFLDREGFLDIETPMLSNATPEGARDYLVPSRIYKGKFFALPQSPQQFKQLLMVSGFDKYFQIAPCFRDEDSRADRSPGEFYQIDIEMSYITQDDLFVELEWLMVRLFKELSNKKIVAETFPRIPYLESMEKYGVDKPDLRFGLEMVDCTDLFGQCELKVFSSQVKSGGAVKVINAKGAAAQPRKFFDDAEEFAKAEGAKGLAWVALREGEMKGPIVKFLSEAERKNLLERMGAEEGDALFFGAGKRADTSTLLGKVRLYLGDKLGMIDRSLAAFCWIVDFPMFEYNEDEKKIDFSHNPFSMPQGGLDALNRKDPLDVLAYQYDIVCNGIELSSGAIRNHRPEVMLKAFAIAGYDEDTVKSKFPALWKAFHYGAPPHGGIAPGLDRIIMLLADEPNIREVIAFPLNQKARDLLMGAPSGVTPKQLRELSLDVKLPPKSAVSG